MIYFILAPEVAKVKVGISKDPVRRLDEMQAHSPAHLMLVGSIPYEKGLEAKIHTHFILHHSHREWFNWTAEVCREVSDMLAGRFDFSMLPADASKAWVHEWRASGNPISPNGKAYASRPTDAAA